GGGRTGRETAEIRGQAISPFSGMAHLCTVAGAVRSSSQSPLCSVSALRRKLHTLPCSSSPHENRYAGFPWGPQQLPAQPDTRKRLSGSTEPKLSHPKGGTTHGFL